MFYNQPLAHRFGTELATDLGREKWTRAEFAVAWVRRSGTRHIEEPFRAFLGRGGVAQITVGVDIENTSIEGLTDLLALGNHGNIETHIYHNEAASTFHPKVYLLRNEGEARLIVGSNNLTAAGLFINTEAGLQIDAPVDDPLICDAREALASWRDTTSGLAKKLDGQLLNDLSQLGYVLPETELRRRRAGNEQKSAQTRAAARRRLFRSQAYSAPPTVRPAVNPAQVAGTVLLMRVRRASEKARRTQVQIPIRVVRTHFFAGIDSIKSAHDARDHALIDANARGALNTIKVELPEIENMRDPVLRLERTATHILYQAFDSNSVLGAPIRHALELGFLMNPPQTYTTVPDRTISTWWRFI